MRTTGQTDRVQLPCNLENSGDTCQESEKYKDSSEWATVLSRVGEPGCVVGLGISDRMMSSNRTSLNSALE